MKTIWRGFKALLLVALGTAVGAAQTDRQAIDHYEAQFEKYLGKDISVMVQEATRQDAGEHADVAIFSLYTMGQRDGGYTHVVVPRSEAHAFSQRYADRDYYQTRPLRGKFMQTPNGNFYISYNGAEFPRDAVVEPAQDSVKSSESDANALPDFDKSPMTSFSYDGKRLIEARVVEVNAESVRIADKYGVAVEVPLDRASKMPDLQMMAKDAMEAALAAKSAAPSKTSSAPTE
jgi:hypothetical protein